MKDFDDARIAYNKAREIAKMLLEQGKLSVAEISAVTKLSEKEISEL